MNAMPNPVLPVQDTALAQPAQAQQMLTAALRMALAAALLALPTRHWAQTALPAATAAATATPNAAQNAAPTSGVARQPQTFQSAVSALPAKPPVKASAAQPKAVVTEKPLAAAAAAQALPDPSVAASDAVRVLLIPALDTTLASPVAGRIRVMESALGAGFNDGVVLISFDCEEANARLNMAKAELAGAVESHESKLRLQGLEQAADVDVALAAAAAAKAKAQVELGRAQVAQCQVRAPWAGRVSKVHVRNHMSVTPGQPLLDLVKTGPLKLKLSVPSKWLMRMQPGVVFDVAIDETGKKYQARVHAMNSRVDSVSQTIEIEATMTRQHPELLAGMSGTAQLEAARK